MWFPRGVYCSRNSEYFGVHCKCGVVCSRTPFYNTKRTRSTSTFVFPICPCSKMSVASSPWDSCQVPGFSTLLFFPIVGFHSSFPTFLIFSIVLFPSRRPVSYEIIELLVSYQVSLDSWQCSSVLVPIYGYCFPRVPFPGSYLMLLLFT